MIDESLAPIVLFVYGRPSHTRKTLEALSKNTLAQQSRLFIFCDGAKYGASEDTCAKIAQVRAIAHECQWCGEVIINEQEHNLGLAASIRNGVSEIIEKYGKIIVVEDDLVTSPAFLSYMNLSLDFYKNYPSVFSIGGYTYPSAIMQIPKEYIFDSYVCLRNCSWGWATWSDRWKKIDWDIDAYSYIKIHPACKSALNRMGDDEFDMLYQQQECGLNIWSIHFTIAHFIHHAVAIYPTQSYVNNAGLDGTGENCSVQPRLWHPELCQNERPRLVDILYEDKDIINAFYNVNCRKKRPIWQKVINSILRHIHKKPKYVIKRKIYS